MRLTRSRTTVCLAATVCVLSTTLAAGGGTAGAVTADDAGLDPARPATALPAAQRLAGLADDQLARVADLNDMSVSDLASEAADPSLWVDAGGKLFYVDDFAYGDRDETVTAGRAPYALSKTFKLHSLGNSGKTIYLDFTGHRVSHTAWNATTGTQRDRYRPYSIDGNVGRFSKREKIQVQLTFQRVAEDYAPFNVDVTTQAPPESQINRSNRRDGRYGTRLLVTRSGPVFTDVCHRKCGGIAYRNVFDQYGRGRAAHQRYQPAFVFTQGVGTSAKNIAEAAAHEVGHNLSLRHDGTRGGAAYNPGHRAWAPIMGVGYYRPVSQWSKGQYRKANNKENDLAKISASGARFRADDHGNTTGSSTPVRRGKVKGVIGRSADQDVFRFRSRGGAYTVAATPAPQGPNLDIRLRILNRRGHLVATANPAVSRVNAQRARGLNARITRRLPSGRYYVQVLGTAYGSPARTGYSRYGSLGKYTVTIRR